MKSVSKNLNSNISQKLFYLLVLVLFLRVDLVFENNTPTGGDMGAHIVAIDTFIKDFMPNFQIIKDDAGDKKYLGMKCKHDAQVIATFVTRAKREYICRLEKL